jgi:septal ring factor EnvC (AmiA/AmiB activator)
MLQHPEEDLKELRGRIEALQKKLSASEESRKDAADALKDSEVAISQANRKLYQISNEQSAAQAQVADIEAEIKQLDGKTKSEKARIETLLRRRYMDGGHDSLKLILNGQDPNVISRQLHYYTYISRARAAQVQTLRGDLDRLAELRINATQHATKLAQLRDQEAGEKAQLEAQGIERKQLLAKISAQVGTQRKEIGRLQQDEKRLTRLSNRSTRCLPKSVKRRASVQRRRVNARKRRIEEAKSETKRAKPAHRAG